MNSLFLHTSFCLLINRKISHYTRVVFSRKIDKIGSENPHVCCPKIDMSIWWCAFQCSLRWAITSGYALLHIWGHGLLEATFNDFVKWYQVSSPLTILLMGGLDCRQWCKTRRKHISYLVVLQMLFIFVQKWLKRDEDLSNKLLHNLYPNINFVEHIY